MSVTFDAVTGSAIVTLPRSIADNNVIIARFKAGGVMGYDQAQFGPGVATFLAGRHDYYRSAFVPQPALGTLQQILAEMDAILTLITVGSLSVDPSYTPDMTQLRDDLKSEIGV